MTRTCSPICAATLRRTRAGTATANANGIATLTRLIPGNASNLGEVLIQAVDADNCQISQLVVHQFE